MRRLTQPRAASTTCNGQGEAKYKSKGEANMFLRFINRLPSAGWKITSMTSMYELVSLTMSMSDKISMFRAMVMHLK